MPFIQSLICLQGCDNRFRFLAIQAASYLAFIITSTLFSTSWLLTLLLLILITAINGLSCLRRLHDAKLTNNWLIAPSASFFIISLIIIFTEANSLYWLLLLSAAVSALLLTYPSDNSDSHYILGYLGPIDLSQYKTQISSPSRRIEPTMHGQVVSMQSSTATHNVIDETLTNTTTPNVNHTTIDLGERIRLALHDKKVAAITLVTIITLIIIAISLSTTNNEPVNDEVNEQQTPTNNTTSTREYLLNMPDDFNLMVNEHQGLIIHWQADTIAETSLWNIKSAQGDKSCQKITFNNKEFYRPLTVVVEQGSEYYASFSPLDTKNLINATAFKNSFTLCGYKFSLKGSQASLAKHQFYQKFLN